MLLLRVIIVTGFIFVFQHICSCVSHLFPEFVFKAALLPRLDAALTGYLQYVAYREPNQHTCTVLLFLIHTQCHNWCKSGNQNTEQPNQMWILLLLKIVPDKCNRPSASCFSKLFILF